MKKYIKYILVSVFMGVSPLSFALSAPVYVDLIYTRDDTGLVYLNFSDKGAGLGCTHPNMVVLFPSKARFKEYYSLLLAAQVADQKVRYSTSGCYGGLYPQLFQLRKYRTDQ